MKASSQVVLPFVLFILIAIGAYVWYATLKPYLMPEAADLSEKELPGTLVFETDSTIVVGSARTQEFLPLVSDGAVSPLSVRGLLAPDQSAGVAARYSEGYVEIVLFSPATAAMPRPVATHTFLSPAPFPAVQYPVWSADSRSLAYVFSPPVPESITAPNGQPFASPDPADGFSIRNPELLSEEYRSSIFVSTEGAEPRRLVSGTPIAFSPDGEHLLIQEGAVLSIVDVDSGEPVTTFDALIEAEAATIPVQVRAVPGGSHIIVWAPAKQAVLYRIDWDGESLSAVGPFPDGASIQELVFDSSTGSAVLALTARGGERSFEVYRIGENIVRSASYHVGLPDDFRLLQWFSQ